MVLVQNKISKVEAKRKKGQSRGRHTDPQALKEIKYLLGDESRQHDLLLEHLHKIQDKFNYISAAHLVALADEMKLSAAKVFEVASFYHHFDIVKEDQSPPPELTVRVCDSLSCHMAGAENLAQQLDQQLENNKDNPFRIQKVS